MDIDHGRYALGLSFKSPKKTAKSKGKRKRDLDELEKELADAMAVVEKLE